jgi:tRNA threonylcarbamoyladenosine biosynthesis protein TsaB
MIILTIKTDNPEAEIGLYEDDKRLAYESWHAHRTLSETIHTKIEKLLKDQNKDWADIRAIVCFKGPGSFTGLRIGLTVANSLAYSLQIPIVGSQSADWIQKGMEQIQKGKDDKTVMPEYGSPAHITHPKK